MIILFHDVFTRCKITLIQSGLFTVSSDREKGLKVFRLETIEVYMNDKGQRTTRIPFFFPKKINIFDFCNLLP